MDCLWRRGHARPEKLLRSSYNESDSGLVISTVARQEKRLKLNLTVNTIDPSNAFLRCDLVVVHDRHFIHGPPCVHALHKTEHLEYYSRVY